MSYAERTALSLLFIVALVLALDFATRRLDRKRIAKLAGLFEGGTAETQFAPHGTGVSSIGTFQGRQAGIQIGRVGPGPYVRISLAGDFSLQFQVRPKRFNKTRALNGALWVILFGLCSYAVDHWSKFGSTTLSNAVGFGVFWGIILRLFRKRFGTMQFYKHSKVPISFPGSESLEFSTVSPKEFPAVIQRPEIQDAVSRLIVSRQVDLLCVAYRYRTGVPALRAANTVEAYFDYRKKWLEPEYVQAMLLDLLVLCNALEAIR